MTTELITEKNIERQILSYLFSKKIFAWKINTVGVYDAKRGVYRKPKSKYLITGVSDILGILPNGKFLAIEVKTPKRKKNLSEHQKFFLTEIAENRGIAIVATSVDDVAFYFENEKSALLDLGFLSL